MGFIMDFKDMMRLPITDKGPDQNEYAEAIKRDILYNFEQVNDELIHKTRLDRDGVQLLAYYMIGTILLKQTDKLKLDNALFWINNYSKDKKPFSVDDLSKVSKTMKKAMEIYKYFKLVLEDSNPLLSHDLESYRNSMQDALEFLWRKGGDRMRRTVQTYRKRKEWFDYATVYSLTVEPSDEFVLLVDGLTTLNEALDEYDKEYGLEGIFHKNVTVKGHLYQYFYRYVKQEDGKEKQVYIGKKEKTPKKMWDNPYLLRLDARHIIVKAPHIIVDKETYGFLKNEYERFSTLPFLQIRGNMVRD